MYTGRGGGWCVEVVLLGSWWGGMGALLMLGALVLGGELAPLGFVETECR